MPGYIDSRLLGVRRLYVQGSDGGWPPTWGFNWVRLGCVWVHLWAVGRRWGQRCSANFELGDFDSGQTLCDHRSLLELAAKAYLTLVIPWSSLETARTSLSWYAPATPWPPFFEWREGTDQPAQMCSELPEATFARVRDVLRCSETSCWFGPTSSTISGRLPHTHTHTERTPTIRSADGGQILAPC